MPRLRNAAVLMSLVGSLAAPGLTLGQGVPLPPIRSVDDLVPLTTEQLDALYRQAPVGGVPPGRVRGRALYPEARFPRARSNAARVAWQGKVFDPDAGTAVNRFFGVRVIRGRVYQAPSWLDGGPSLILDYQGTSTLYGGYRDEIRQVAPGIYLGLMYDRTEPAPRLKLMFAFEAIE